MSNHKEVPGKLGKVYCHEGFTYYEDKIVKGLMYLKCKSNATLGGSLCGGQAIIDLAKDVLKVPQGHAAHDHPLNDDEKLICKIKLQCKIHQRPVLLNLREVYDIIVQKVIFVVRLGSHNRPFDLF